MLPERLGYVKKLQETAVPRSYITLGSLSYRLVRLSCLYRSETSANLKRYRECRNV